MEIQIVGGSGGEGVGGGLADWVGGREGSGEAGVGTPHPPPPPPGVAGPDYRTEKPKSGTANKGGPNTSCFIKSEIAQLGPFQIL